MTEQTIPGQTVYDPADPALRRRVLDGICSMAVNGYGPSGDMWDKSRPAGLPSGAWIHKHWGRWAALVREAGLHPRRPNTVKAAQSDLNAPLLPAERHACANRGLYERGW